MQFAKTTTEHIPLLEKYFSKQTYRTCDYSVGACMMWRKYFDTHHAEFGGFLIFKIKMPDGRTAFSYPVGEGDIGAVLDELQKQAQSDGIPFILSDIPQEAVSFLEEKYGGSVEISTDRDTWDYLYEADKMATFSGKKLSAQRNRVHKFFRTYDGARFLEIDENNKEAAKQFCVLFTRSEQNHKNISDEEARSSIELFDYMDKMHAFGGIVEYDGKIIGVSIGEIVGDTMFIHVEKALHEYSGVYQALVNSFAAHYANDTVKYINREEDDGVEGLRISKMSYRPCKLLEKFTAIVR